MPGADKDAKLANKKEKEDKINKELAKLVINQNFSKVVNENKNKSMAYDGKSLYPSFLADKASYYPKIETGFFVYSS